MAAIPSPRTALLRGDAPPGISGEGIRKVFGKLVALDAVSFDVRVGEILGLAGENGAGKSTLLNILSGVFPPNAGRLSIRGSYIALESPLHANQLGVFRMYQEASVIGAVPAYENVFLGFQRYFTRAGVLNRRAMRRRAADYLAKVEPGGIDPGVRTSELPFARRQLLQLARALAGADLLEIREPILLLDEPTAALHDSEVRALFSLLHEMRERAAIIFVSHRLPELLAITDRICVLRDGRVAGEAGAADASEGSLHQSMVGRQRADDFYRVVDQQEPSGEVLLQVNGLSLQGAFEDVDLTLYKGQILGIAGVENSGKEALARCISGAYRPTAGSVRIAGQTLVPSSPKQMLKHGVGFLPADRAGESLVLSMKVYENVTLASLSEFVRNLGVVRVLKRRMERDRTKEEILRLRIKASETSLVRELSGGTQQKVAVAKWLLRRLKVLVAENPTQGIDVGAKYELYASLREMAREGHGVVLISDDLPEVIGVSDRILVMKDGRMVSEIRSEAAAKPSERSLIESMV